MRREEKCGWSYEAAADRYHTLTHCSIFLGFYVLFSRRGYAIVDSCLLLLP